MREERKEGFLLQDTHKLSLRISASLEGKWCSISHIKTDLEINSETLAVYPPSSGGLDKQQTADVSISEPSLSWHLLCPWLNCVCQKNDGKTSVMTVKQRQNRGKS